MVQDGLEGPPEELPAEEGALDDDEDLPIEDLLDTEEDEDLSLAALLRRRMQEVCGVILVVQCCSARNTWKAIPVAHPSAALSS